MLRFSAKPNRWIRVTAPVMVERRWALSDDGTNIAEGGTSSNISQGGLDLLGWIKRMFREQLARRDEFEFRRQLQVYSGMDSAEVALLLFGAALTRRALQDNGTMPLGFGMSSATDPAFTLVSCHT